MYDTNIKSSSKILANTVTDKCQKFFKPFLKQLDRNLANTLTSIIRHRQPRGGCSTDPDDYHQELNAYTLLSPNYLRHKGAELGEAVGSFADKLQGGSTPWYKMRQAYKLLRLGEKYIPLLLNNSCQKALAVDLIDVRRLEHILSEALEQEALPAMTAMMPPPGRFARHGSVFAIGNDKAVTTTETTLVTTWRPK